MTFNTANQGASSTTAPQLTPGSSASDEHNQTPAVAARTLASCDLCRRRKIKCDRGKPCSNCLRSGVVCVSSAISRVPRRRQGGRRKPDGEILKRIAKLENLVKYLETENSGVTPADSVANNGGALPTSEVPDTEKASEVQLKSLESAPSPVKDNLDRYLGTSFWVTLSDEVRFLPSLSSFLGSAKIIH
jgi:hypothetical protein